MSTLSFKRLSPETLARYEQAERAGTLTPRQAAALESHRLLPLAVEAMRAQCLEDKAARSGQKLGSDKEKQG
jgi:hypothetical protein